MHWFSKLPTFPRHRRKLVYVHKIPQINGIAIAWIGFNLRRLTSSNLFSFVRSLNHPHHFVYRMLFVLSLFLLRRRVLFGFIKSERKSSQERKKERIAHQKCGELVFLDVKNCFMKLTRRKEWKKKPSNWILGVPVPSLCASAQIWNNIRMVSLFLLVSLYVYILLLECVCVLTTIHTRTQNKNDNLFTQFRYECVWRIVYTQSLACSLAWSFVRQCTHKPKNVCVCLCLCVRVCTIESRDDSSQTK